MLTLQLWVKIIDLVFMLTNFFGELSSENFSRALIERDDVIRNLNASANDPDFFDEEICMNASANDPDFFDEEICMN